MKKSLSIFLILLILFLTSCNQQESSDNAEKNNEPNRQGDATKLLKSAIESNNNLTSFDADFAINMSLDFDGQTQNIAIDMNCQYDIENMSFKISEIISTPGSSTVEALLFYKDGTIYMSSGGQNISQTLSANEISQYTSSFDLLDFEDTAIKQSSSEKVGDNTKITMLLDGKSIGGLFDQIYTMFSSMFEGIYFELKFDDIDVIYEITTANLIEYQDMKFTFQMDIDVEGEGIQTVNVKANSKTTFTSFNQPVVIEIPNIDDYIEAVF